jgi:hypothetical protein
MATNNILLYNAALNGFLAGQLAGTQIDTNTTPATTDFTAMVAQAVTFAVAMDAAIPNDNAGGAQPAGTGPISVVTTGVAIAPTTSAITEAQAVKVQLLQALCFGYSFQKFQANFVSQASPPISFATIIAQPIQAIKAVYLAAVASAIYT